MVKQIIEKLNEANTTQTPLNYSTGLTHIAQVVAADLNKKQKAGVSGIFRHIPVNETVNLHAGAIQEYFNSVLGEDKYTDVSLLKEDPGVKLILKALGVFVTSSVADEEVLSVSSLNSMGISEVL